jgi:ubiquinone/menaquinone biosynthesis C-methylase UbiE
MANHDTHYFIDVENPAELARLMHQGTLLTRALGGPLDGLGNGIRQRLRSILDVACGPGEWALRVAQEDSALTPTTEVTGIDLSQHMIAYAHAQAEMRDVINAIFAVMNMLHPLAFPDATFDLVHARTLMAVIPTARRTEVMQEYRRITRPGGVIYLTECEMPISASPNHMRLNDLISEATHAAGHGFSRNGHQIVITPMLIPLLKQVGCQQIQSRGYGLSITPESDLYEGILEQATVSYQLLRPFVVSKGFISEEDYKTLTMLALADMQAPDFCAIWYFLSAWGTIPADNWNHHAKQKP